MMAAPTPGSILVIDDEPSIVRGLARLLHRDGYRVATARNGRDALAQLQGQCYDVILSDLRMPELDGRVLRAAAAALSRAGRAGHLSHRGE
jgi:CheY-like chemotaxis protein